MVKGWKNKCQGMGIQGRILVWALVLLSMPFLAKAGTYNELTYTSDGTSITITDCSSSAVNVTIPKTINSLPVTTIGDGAFSWCSSLTSVIIPDSITSIGDYAFRYSGLTSLTIPSSVISIGESAFWQIADEENALIAIAVDPANPGFSSLDGVLFNKNQTALIQCPAGKTGSYTIPGTVTNLASGAFYGCSLTDVTVPSAVNTIGGLPFQHGVNLVSITVDPANAFYSSHAGVLFNKNQTELIQYPAGNTAGSYTVPDGVVNIGDGAFARTYNLSGVVIPNTVTNIGQWAFERSRITSLSITDGLESIEGWAFTDCANLIDLTIPDSVTNLGFAAFDDCTSLTNLVIGNGVTYIEQATFAGSTSLINVTFGAGIKSMGNYAFGDVISTTGPQHGYFLGNAPSVTSTSFGSINGLRIHYLPSTTGWNTTLGGYPTEPWNPDLTYTQEGSSITITGYTGPGGDVFIPDTINGVDVRTIADGAFANINTLTNVVVGANITTIGDGSFSNCTNLAKMYFLGNAPATSATAFSGSDSLVVYHFPSTTGWEATLGGRPAEPWITSDYTVTRYGAYIKVSNYTGPGGDVVVPDMINGLPVGTIGSGTFSGKTNLTSVVIPDTVSSIESGAFQFCTSLTNVSFGHSITSIGQTAFRDCDGLTSIAFPDSVASIGNYAFQSCNNLADAFINSGTIGDSAFQSCANLTNIVLGNGVNSIGQNAFRDCDGMPSITIPLTVASLGSYAFGYCDRLASVDISCGTIGDYAFNFCTNLTTVTLGDGVSSIGQYAFRDCDSLISIAIPQTVAILGNYAFGYCDSLGEAVINCSSVGIQTFYNCSSLTNVVFGSGASSISNSAFANCTSLSSLTIPENVTGFGYSAFSGCTKLADVAIECRLTGNNTFQNCTSLTNVVFGTNVASIGSSAFYNCTSLIGLTLPESVTSLGGAAFRNCTNMICVYFEGDAPSVYSNTFDGDNSLIVYYLQGTTGWDATFGGRPTELWDPSLTYVSDGTSITITGYTGTVSNITIPATIAGLPVTSIGTDAFRNWGNLISVVIGSEITNIADGAFSDCPNLVSLYFMGDAPSVTSTAFSGSDSLGIYYQPDASGWGATLGGLSTEAWNSDYAFTQYGSSCIIDDYTGAGGSVSIPGTLMGLTVSAIGNGVFYANTNLTGVVIPDSVQSIGDNAFNYCSNLTDVVIGEGVTSIGTAAFNNCPKLAHASIRVPSIEDRMFDSFQNLTDIDFEDSVTNIGASAFNNYSTITNVLIGTNVTSIGNGAFYSCTSLGNILIPSSVTDMGESIFWSCGGLTEATIESGSVGYGMFNNCGSLTNVVFGDGVTNIEDLAFYRCSGLSSITIPSSITRVGIRAFDSCTSLNRLYFRGDAPASDSSLFYNVNNATVYYLPGTGGWEATFGGRPTVLWNPVIQAGSGVGTNGFSFGIAGTPGIPIMVEACTDLVEGNWEPLATTNLVGGSMEFSDPDWTNYPNRIYRIAAP